MRDTEVIVSKTDLQGNITYANQDLVNVSGYSREELLGAPQNILRHPDMPAEVFADLWRTVKMGRVWKSMIKNRCKNGDHYWVEANVAPLVEGGKVVGYTSIRVKPSREQVAQADALYRRMRADDARVAISGGTVQEAPRMGWLQAVRASSLGVKLGLMCGGVVGLFAAALVCVLLDWRLAALLASLLGGAATCVEWYLLRHYAIAPLREIRRNLEHMGDGDLSLEVKLPDGLESVQASQALSVLQVNIKLLIGQIKEAGIAVNAGVSEMAAGHQQMMAHSACRADSLEEAGVTMAKLVGLVRDNAAVIRRDASADGTLAPLMQNADQITETIGKIERLAFQNNLLALNAVAEAARVSKLGCEFTAVAEQMGLQAAQLIELVGQFKLVRDDGVVATRVAAPAQVLAASV
jgi:aerotaxis receptor